MFPHRPSLTGAPSRTGEANRAHVPPPSLRCPRRSSPTPVSGVPASLPSTLRGRGARLLRSVRPAWGPRNDATAPKIRLRTPSALAEARRLRRLRVCHQPPRPPHLLRRAHGVTALSRLSPPLRAAPAPAPPPLATPSPPPSGVCPRPVSLHARNIPLPSASSLLISSTPAVHAHPPPPFCVVTSTRSAQIVPPASFRFARRSFHRLTPRRFASSEPTRPRRFTGAARPRRGPRVRGLSTFASPPRPLRRSMPSVSTMLRPEKDPTEAARGDRADASRDIYRCERGQPRPSGFRARPRLANPRLGAGTRGEAAREEGRGEGERRRDGRSGWRRALWRPRTPGHLRATQTGCGAQSSPVAPLQSRGNARLSGRASCASPVAYDRSRRRALRLTSPLTSPSPLPDPQCSSRCPLLPTALIPHPIYAGRRRTPRRRPLEDLMSDLVHLRAVLRVWRGHKCRSPSRPPRAAIPAEAALEPPVPLAMPGPASHLFPAAGQLNLPAHPVMLTRRPRAMVRANTALKDVHGARHLERAHPRGRGDRGNATLRASARGAEGALRARGEGRGTGRGGTCGAGRDVSGEPRKEQSAPRRSPCEACATSVAPRSRTRLPPSPLLPFARTESSFARGLRKTWYMERGGRRGGRAGRNQGRGSGAGDRGAEPHAQGR